MRVCLVKKRGSEIEVLRARDDCCVAVPEHIRDDGAVFGLRKVAIKADP